jgi:hypothetical protein
MPGRHLAGPLWPKHTSRCVARVLTALQRPRRAARAVPGGRFGPSGSAARAGTAARAGGRAVRAGGARTSPLLPLLPSVLPLRRPGRSGAPACRPSVNATTASRGCVVVASQSLRTVACEAIAFGRFRRHNLSPAAHPGCQKLICWKTGWRSARVVRSGDSPALASAQTSARNNRIRASSSR